MARAKLQAPSSQPLLKLDKHVRKVMLPYRDTPAVKAADWFSKIGDQPQMRIVAGATLAVGLLRRDLRMVRAGARMLISHEVANWAKNEVKDRVIRARPRSADGPGEAKPKKGRDKRKEQSSFPSGHAAGAMAVAGAIAAEYPQHAALARTAAGLVAVARLPRCAHYPTDVAAGAAVGAASSGLVNASWNLAARAARRWLSPTR
jgi:membrane-associated phospholipid phosphatase